MRAIQSDGTAFCDMTVYNLLSFKHHSLLHRFVADVKQFDGFNKNVGKVAVKPPCHFVPLGFTHFRKRRSQIQVDHTATITHDIACHECKQIGNEIERTKWQQSQSVKQQP